jgi:hypothetical protein
MLGNYHKKFNRHSRYDKQKKKDSRREFYEVVDRAELEERFPELNDVLIVKFGYHHLGEHQNKSLEHPQFILSQSLPFVFEVYSEILKMYLYDHHMGDTILYLSQLRRIRIIQSLKTRDLLFSTLENKQGQVSEKVQLDVCFSHPLTNKKLKNLHFQIPLKNYNKEDLHGLVSLNESDNEGSSQVEFPENCCVVSLKLIRKAMVRSFTCLVWFMEKKFKQKKVYFCSAKMDLNTKVNLYFTAKNQLYETSQKQSDVFSPDMDLVLSKIEICIGSPNQIKEYQEKYEFYQSVKKSNMNEDEENYRFNVENLQPHIEQAQSQQLLNILGEPSNLEQIFFQKLLELSELDNSTLANQGLLLPTLTCKHSNEEGVGIPSSLTTAIEQVSSPLFKMKAPDSGKRIPDSVLTSPEAMLDASKDRILCLDLQNQVKELDRDIDSAIINRLFRSILPNLVSIACGVYGNFLVQILITKLAPAQRRMFLVSYSKELANLCLDTKGIFCVQTLVDQLSSDEEFRQFLKLIEDHLALLIKDNQAGFVLKKVIQTFSTGYIQQLLELIRPRFLEFASDKYGICVIKFIIKRFEGDVNLFEDVTADFLMHTKKGKQNSHFNFGLQHLIDAANQKRWKLKELEDVMICFMSGSHKTKVRSKAVVQTVKLIYNYHDRNFIETLIKPHVILQFEYPLTTNEVDLLQEAKRRWPDWAELQEIEEKPTI